MVVPDPGAGWPLNDHRGVLYHPPVRPRGLPDGGERPGRGSGGDPGGDRYLPVALHRLPGTLRLL